VVSNIFKNQQPKISTNVSIEDQWHRLYEAAGMTGDSEPRQHVFKRMQCTNKLGIADAVYIETNEGVACRRADKTIHQLHLSEYGAYFKHITQTHHAWTLANLDFVRSVSSKRKAEAYLSSVEGRVAIKVNESRLVSDSLTNK
jgi:hypothetical protein